MGNNEENEIAADLLAAVLAGPIAEANAHRDELWAFLTTRYSNPCASLCAVVGALRNLEAVAVRVGLDGPRLVAWLLEHGEAPPAPGSLS